MAEMLEEGGIESTTVGVYRTAATVKGGRRFSFSSLVVVGDRHGSVGFGYGKANQVPPAIEKAQKEGRRRMKRYPLQGRTIPHAVTGRFGSCEVRLLPASPGTGVIAGAAVRAPLELLGIQDCLTKSFGSNNDKNLVKAVINGLNQLRSKDMIEQLRGVTLEKTEVEEAIERGTAFLSQTAAPAAAESKSNGTPADASKDKPASDKAKSGDDKAPAEAKAETKAETENKAESVAPAAAPETIDSGEAKNDS